MQLPTVKEWSDTSRRTADVFAAAALIIICCVVPSRARAQTDYPSPHGDNGRILYEKYCTPCHGTGGGPGSAVFADSKQPIDLRTYVQRHGGNFPRDTWFAVVTGDPVANAHSAIWEKIRTDAGTTADSEIAAHGIVVTIADYVISIQAK